MFYIFSACNRLTSITIGNNVKNIDNYAFCHCYVLNSVTIGNNVTNIGDYAFQYCSNLTSITIPNSVLSIGNYAFWGCSNLASISISSSVTNIGKYIFSNCYKLKEIIVEEENAKYDSRNNCNAIIETSANKLLYGCKETIIPNSIESIGSCAFLGCSELTSISIPDCVTSIEERAFSGCSGLNSMTIPNSLTNIGEGAFAGCYIIASVTIPNSVTIIGENAFSGCYNLTSVTEEKETPPSIFNNSFSNRTNATLYVPYGCKTAYEAADYWNEFKEILELSPSALTISSVGVGTYCSVYDLDFTGSDVKAYVVSSFDEENAEVTLTRINNVKAGTGIVVKGNAGSYNIPIRMTAKEASNLLIGVTEDTELSKTEGDYTNYILGRKNGETGFYAVENGSTLAAGKAYLPLPTASVPQGSEARSIRFVFDDEETTGIENCQPDQMTNTKAGRKQVIYNMQGQKLSGLQKGINIINGKKVYKAL